MQTIELYGGYSQQVGAHGTGSRALRILLCEDDPASQVVEARLLQRLGHTVVVVSYGQGVLQELDRAEYDLLLLDMQLPGMSGFEVIRKIREMYAGQLPLPIIAVTVLTFWSELQQIREAGCDGYVPKPILFTQLAAEIERVMQLRRDLSSRSQADIIGP